MTFDEFKYMALHPKECDAPGVYKVKLYKYDTHSLYPILELEEDHESVFPTFEEAKRCVTGFDITKNSKPYCSFITYHKYGEETLYGHYNKRWIFDYEGNQLDESLSPGTVEYHYNPFRGRPENLIRFKPGDIIEVLDLDEMTASLAIVAREPISIEKAWEINLKRCQEKRLSGIKCEPGEDEIAVLMTYDDYYRVIHLSEAKNDFYSTHVHPTLIIKPHDEVPESMKQTLNIKLKEYQNRNS